MIDDRRAFQPSLASSVEISLAADRRAAPDAEVNLGAVPSPFGLPIPLSLQPPASKRIAVER